MPLRAQFSLRKLMGLRFNSAILLPNSGNAGSGIVLILVLMAVASISMMGALTLSGVQQKTRTQNMLPYHVQIWRGNLLAILTSTANFNQTALDLTNNPSMTCVNNPLASCPATSEQIYWVRTVVDTGATTAAYKLDGTNGITPAGQTCPDFPSDTCPIRFKVFWRCTSNCGASAPPPREYSIDITTEYNPNPAGVGSTKSQVAFDPNKYAIGGTVGTILPLSSIYFKP